MNNKNSAYRSAKNLLQLQEMQANDTRSSIQRAHDTMANTRMLSEALMTANKEKIITLISQLPENQLQEIGYHISYASKRLTK